MAAAWAVDLGVDEVELACDGRGGEPNSNKLERSSVVFMVFVVLVSVVANVVNVVGGGLQV